MKEFKKKPKFVHGLLSVPPLSEEGRIIYFDSYIRSSNKRYSQDFWPFMLNEGGFYISFSSEEEREKIQVDLLATGKAVMNTFSEKENVKNLKIVGRFKSGSFMDIYAPRYYLMFLDEGLKDLDIVWKRVARIKDLKLLFKKYAKKPVCCCLCQDGKLDIRLSKTTDFVYFM